MVLLQEAVSGLSEQRTGERDACRGTKVTVTDVNGAVGHARVVSDGSATKGDTSNMGDGASQGASPQDDLPLLLKEIHRILLDGGDGGNGG